MDNTTLKALAAFSAVVGAGLYRIWRKLKTIDAKIELVTQTDRTASVDVWVGGRRKTDPPLPPGAPIPTVLPVDRRD